MFGIKKASTAQVLKDRAYDLAEQGRELVAPKLEEILPKVSDAVDQAKARIAAEAPVKAEAAKKAAQDLVDGSATIAGLKEDARAMRNEFLTKASDVAHRAASHADEASKQVSKRADKASKKLAKKADKASRKVAKRAQKASGKKGHKGLITLLLLALAGAAGAVWYRRSQPVEDPWAEEYWEDVDFDATTAGKTEKGGCCKSADAKKEAEKAAEDVKDKAADVADKASDKAKQAADKAADGIDKTVEAVKNAVEDAKK